FDVSRAIYKSMLEFLAHQYQTAYVVQPLPVSHFQAVFSANREVTLNWQPVSDPLEPAAEPDRYVVYTREEGKGFDNGVLTDKPQYTIQNLDPGKIYSFKVCALNDGGLSFPSEILSVCYMDELQEPVLIVNGFDRIAPPATLETHKYTGFADFWDQGVPDKYNLNYIGRQYDYDPHSLWLDDDAPGHGASYANFETRRIAGNTFDFPLVHGQSIRAAGHSFIAVSDEAVMDGMIDLTDYHYVDLILGEEKTTPWPKPIREPQFSAFPLKLQHKITEYLQPGKHLFLSGAYVGSDLWNTDKDSVNIRFANEVLKYFFRTNYAVTTGGLHAVDTTFFAGPDSLTFITELNEKQYAVEAPDAIEPADSLAKTILRYSENNTSAAVAYKGQYDVVVLGFPFESVNRQKSKDALMEAVFNFFKRATGKQLSFYGNK
ncbi:MAG: xanthan lyase, partial [Caldithrix sp.]|nr:xanthan lyase [Caldithrix sp.]